MDRVEKKKKKCRPSASKRRQLRKRNGNITYQGQVSGMVNVTMSVMPGTSVTITAPPVAKPSHHSPGERSSVMSVQPHVVIVAKPSAPPSSGNCSVRSDQSSTDLVAIPSSVDDSDYRSIYDDEQVAAYRSDNRADSDIEIENTSVASDVYLEPIAKKRVVASRIAEKTSSALAPKKEGS